MVEDQLRSPLDLVTVEKERKLHKPNCWTKRWLFIVVWIIRTINTSVSMLCFDST